MVFGIGLPLRIAEQVNSAFRLFAHQHRQLRKYLDQSYVAAGGRDENILTVFAKHCLQ